MAGRLRCYICNLAGNARQMPRIGDDIISVRLQLIGVVFSIYLIKVSKMKLEFALTAIYQ